MHDKAAARKHAIYRPIGDRKMEPGDDLTLPVYPSHVA